LGYRSPGTRVYSPGGSAPPVREGKWTGRIEEVEPDLFVDVPPGGTFSPLEPDRERVLWFDGWRPGRPGRHRIRFIYDTSPRRWGAWAEHGPPELQVHRAEERCAWSLREVQRPSPELEARFLRLHHEGIVSPWVDFEVGP